MQPRSGTSRRPTSSAWPTNISAWSVRWWCSRISRSGAFQAGDLRKHLGIGPAQFLGTPTLALASVTLVSVWQLIGFIVVVMVAATTRFLVITVMVVVMAVVM